jgi:hypothetical protein
MLLTFAPKRLWREAFWWLDSLESAKTSSTRAVKTTHYSGTNFNVKEFAAIFFTILPEADG